MSGLCLLAGAAMVALGTETATLRWTHSVERIEWEERWGVEAGELRLEEARVRGSGAGMDPPPEARRIGDQWVWRPALPLLPEVVLRRSGATADWRICVAGACRPFDELVPAKADPVRLAPCPG